MAVQKIFEDEDRSQIEYLDLLVDSDIENLDEANKMLAEMIAHEQTSTPEHYPNVKVIRVGSAPEWNDFLIQWFVRELNGKLAFPVEAMERGDCPVVVIEGKGDNPVSAFIDMLRQAIKEPKPEFEDNCGCPICLMRRASKGIPEPEEYNEGRTPRIVAAECTDEEWEAFDEIYHKMRAAGRLPENYPRPSLMRNPA